MMEHGRKPLRRQARRLLLASSVGTAAFSTGLYASPHFDEVSSSTSGLTHHGETYGASWGDMNGDLYPDLHANNHRNVDAFYRNNGDGTFTNVLSSMDVNGIWTAHPYIDTHGSAWGDVQNNGSEDLYISTGGPNYALMLMNNGTSFVDQAVALGVQQDAEGRTPFWLDVTGDGKLDLAVMIASYARLFTQNPNGTFANVTTSAGFNCPGTDHGQATDVDGDGVLDIICAKDKWPKTIYKTTTAPFTNITSTVPLVSRAIDEAIADFDGDLSNDSIVVSGSYQPSDAGLWSPMRLEAELGAQANKEKGLFFNTTGVLNVTLYVKGNAQNPKWVHVGSSGGQPANMVAFATGFSFTLDPSDPSTWGVEPHTPGTDPGAFIGYDPSTNQWQFWYSGITGHAAGSYWVVDSSSAMSNLQMQNLIQAELPERPHLVMHTPTGYQEQGLLRGFPKNLKVSCSSVAAADFDNDGDVDVYFTCRTGVKNLPNRLFENKSELGSSSAGTFQEVTGHGAEGVQGFFISDQAGLSDSVVTADYDLDGCVDLFVTNGVPLNPFRHPYGPDELFHNTCNYGNNWLELDLQGLGLGHSNRDAVGAKVYITTPDGKQQMREQNGGTHRWSQNFKRIHFGLAKNAQVDQLQVVWPSGQVDTFTNVAPNHLYLATEQATALVQEK